MPDEQSKKVESLSQFIECLESIHPSKDEIVVYRGHSDKCYELKPGLLRKGNEGLRDNEAEIFRDIEAARPMSFINDNTTLDKLVTMQHYGLPTRLLDVTSNPLTALYFAVTSRQEKDGTVLVLKASKSINKFFDSDTVTCLANLVHLNKKAKDEVIELIKKNIVYYDYVKSYIEIPCATREQQISSEQKEGIEIYKKIHEKYKKFKEKISNSNIKDSDVDDKFVNGQRKDRRNKFNDKRVIKHFLNFIRADKTYFQPKICPEDLFKILLVKAKQRNARVATQDGAFLIFGLEDNYSQKIPEISIEKIVIPGEKKEKMAQALSSLGIRESSLFPELEYYTKYVVYIYNKKS